MKRSQIEDYQSAGFAESVGYGERPALIAIDFMMAYFENSSPMSAGVGETAQSALRILEAARRRDLPVFVTQQYFDADQAGTVYARKVPALKLLERGSPLAELLPGFGGEGEPLIKRFPSAFHQTDLAARLEAARVDTLIITGLTTSGCVRATAMDAMLNGFSGIVVREAVGDRDEAQHRANLFDINAKLADVRGEAEVLDWMTRR